MKLRKGDKVKVITGKDKGKSGAILMVLKESNRVVVEGVNIVKKAVKPGRVSKEGGIIKVERPINASNVMFLDDKAGKPVRLGSKLTGEKKYRISRATDEVVDKKL
jgi:large subunit ribosomal protein L24